MRIGGNRLGEQVSLEAESLTVDLSGV